MFKLLVCGFTLCVFSSTIFAQTDSRFYPSAQMQSDWYGRGVHQYFEGQYDEAVDTLTTAISVDPNDPRPYFFRGLAKQQPESKAVDNYDFRQGAERETYKTGRASSLVNRSLERIQGEQRHVIERYRRDARLAFYQSGNQPSEIAPPIITEEVIEFAPMSENKAPSQSPPLQYPAPIEKPIPQEEVVPTNEVRQADPPTNEIPSIDENPTEPPSPELDSPPTSDKPDSNVEDDPFGG